MSSLIHTGAGNLQMSDDTQNAVITHCLTGTLRCYREELSGTQTPELHSLWDTVHFILLAVYTGVLAKLYLGHVFSFKRKVFSFSACPLASIMSVFRGSDVIFWTCVGIVSGLNFTFGLSQCNFQQTLPCIAPCFRFSPFFILPLCLPSNNFLTS